MGWVSDAIGIAAAPFTGGASLAWSGSERQKEEEEKRKAMQDERYGLMMAGRQEGRELGERVTGQTQEQTGLDVQDYVSRVRGRLDRPSYRAESIRRSGQQEKRYAASKGASDAQKQNVAYQSAMAAGQAEDEDYERRQRDFGQMVNNIMGTQSALEASGAQMGLYSQYIQPPKQSTGILSSALGLI